MNEEMRVSLNAERSAERFERIASERNPIVKSFRKVRRRYVYIIFFNSTWNELNFKMKFYESDTRARSCTLTYMQRYNDILNDLML